MLTTKRSYGVTEDKERRSDEAEGGVDIKRRAVDNGREGPVKTATHSHEEVKRLAHQFWEKRGRPCGTPEADWFRAKRVLSMERDRIPSIVARAIGSVVGNAVGIVTNLREHGHHTSQISCGPRISSGPEVPSHLNSSTY